MSNCIVNWWHHPFNVQILQVLFSSSVSDTGLIRENIMVWYCVFYLPCRCNSENEDSSYILQSVASKYEVAFWMSGCQYHLCKVFYCVTQIPSKLCSDFGDMLSRSVTCHHQPHRFSYQKNNNAHVTVNTRIHIQC